MELSDLIEKQRRFDSERHTTYAWSSPITSDDLRPLLHNVLSLTGEAGEVANLVKKFDRGDFDFERLLDEIPRELADVVIYVFKIAYQSGIDLEKAILEKMASNEIRFPTSASAHAAAGAKPPILLDAELRAEHLPQSSLDMLARCYVDVKITPPASSMALVAGMLLAIRVAKLANREGNPDMVEYGWLELKETADAVNLSFDELVDLGRHYDEVVRILGLDGNATSPV